MMQVTETCMELLHTIADALAEWSAAVSEAAQEQQQADGQRLPVQLVNTASEHELKQLRESKDWLPALAAHLLHCMQRHRLDSICDEQELLDTLGQLIPRVLHLRPFAETKVAAASCLAASPSIVAAACSSYDLMPCVRPCTR